MLLLISMNTSEDARRASMFFLVVAIFMLGWLTNTIYYEANSFDIQRPLSSIFTTKDVFSPGDKIPQDRIHVYDDKIVIDVEKAQWAEFTDTNSMDPVLDIEANSFEIRPKSHEEIDVGDIISYKPRDYKGLIVHRVIKTGFDEDGWYAIAKGDNLSKPDKEKIRFDQINGVLVGIIY